VTAAHGLSEPQLTKPRFSRVWVIQEFVLAPTVMFYIGPVVMPSTIFSRAREEFQSYLVWPYSTSPESLPAFCPTLLNTGITKFVQFSELKGDIRNHTRSLTVLELRLRLSQRFASVDLDQVYSLYGIANYIQSHHDKSHGGKRELIPNYNNPPEFVYTEVTLAHFEERQSLRPLSLSSYKHNHPNTPSWVIDWTVLQSNNMTFDNHLWTHMYDKFNADQGLDIHTPAFSSKDGFLFLEGFLADEVALAARYNHKSEISSFMETLRRYDPNTTYHGDQKHTWVEAYFRTILADGVRDTSYGATNDDFNRLPPSTYPNAMTRRLPFVLQSYSPWNIEDPNPVESGDRSSISEHDRMWGRCHWRSSMLPPASPDRKYLENLAIVLEAQAKGILGGRTLFLTKGGYLGVTHTCIPGDQIYIVRGGRTPLILRELSKIPEGVGNRRDERLKIDSGADCKFGEGKEYQVVTDCYLHGFMDGGHDEKLLRQQGKFTNLTIV
jgi:hypothetical protein